MLSERDIKQAVLDKLSSKALADDAVIVSEMVVGKADRRADLVVANGHLHAVEIKSDLDSLRRLEGQLAVYLSRFDKVTLVVSKKFVEQALESSPSRVAVWEASETSAGIAKLTIRRQGRIEPVKDKSLLCDFLLKSELLKIARLMDESARLAELSREALVEKIKALPLTAVRKYVLANVKDRYRETFHRAANTDAAEVPNVDNLSRITVKRRAVAMSVEPTTRTRHYEPRQVNLLRFFPDGDIPEGIPTHVLVPVVN
ncbi:sce7726 family protein [Burkholderia cepacia]|uniref:sce7726 family protein n=1 Tax=Burkholderia cepacia TaxID=292 RepID=UPI00069F17D3|nr:sce7726 family protein [Burkholderia cepacia]